MFKNLETAGAFLTEALANDWQLFEHTEIEAKIAEIYDTVPVSAREDLGGDMIIVVANSYDTYMAAVKGKDAGVPALKTDKTKAKTKTTFSAPQLDDASSEALDKIISNTTEAKLKRQSVTKITRLFFASPRLRDLPACKDLKVKVKYKDEQKKKFEEYGAKLVDTVENHKAYDAAMEVIKTEGSVKPYFSENYGRIYGCEVAMGNEPAKPYSIPALTSLMLTDLFLAVPTSESGIGAKITGITPKSDNKMGTDVTSKGTVLPKFFGKKEAIEAHNFGFINDETKEKIDTKSIATELSFKIKTDAGLEKTIRVRGVAEKKIPVFARKDEYKTIFGEMSRTNYVPSQLSTEEIAAAKATQRSIIAALATNSISNAGTFSDSIMDIVKQIKKAENTSAGSAATAFGE